MRGRCSDAPRRSVSRAAIRHVMMPGMIEEDGDRPIEMKPKMDVLDFWSIIKPELPGVNGLCTQVTAFMDEPALRAAADRAGDSGIEGIAFVGVPRTMNDGEGSGVAPTDALSIFDHVVPNRGAILIPDPRGRARPLQLQMRSGRDLRHDAAAVLRRHRRIS